MRARVLLILTMAAGAAMIGLSGCDSATGNPAAGNPAAGGGTPQRGGTLTFAVATDPLCLDPQQAGSGDAISVTRPFVDSLTDQDPATGKIVPWVATSWTVNTNATSFTFHLRGGITFSDGTALNAQAVKDNFDGLIRLGARAVQASTYLSGYKDAVVLDPATVRIDFSRPTAQFLQATSTSSLGLVAEATLAKSAADRCVSGVIGSGPFTVGSYQPNQQVVENARPGYAWPSSLSPNAGAAYLKKLVFRIIPEDSIRVGSLESGQLDGIGSVAPQDESALKDAGFVLRSRAAPGLVYGLNINTARPITSDVTVRRAIQKAVDRQQIVSTVLSADYKPATSVLSSATPFYADESASLTTDVAGARAMLDGDGWVLGSDGVRVKNGERLSLVVTWFQSGSGPTQSALELFQQQLKAVGIAIVLKPVPEATALATFKAGEYDLIWGNASSTDPDILRNYYTIAGLNAVRLTDGPLQTALYTQAADGDPAARTRDTARAQALLVQDAYAIPIYEASAVISLSAKVHDVTFDSSSRLQFHDAWIS